MSRHLGSEFSRTDNRLASPTSTYSAARPEPPSSWTSTAQPQGPTLQGFHLDARYEIKIHTDGSALEDLTYWVTFGPADQAGEQAVALHRLTGPDACDDDATGQLLAPRVAPTRRLGSRWPADVGRTGRRPVLRRPAERVQLDKSI
jgi:hypothetical protein